MILLKGNPISTNTIYKFVCQGRFPRMYLTDYGNQLKEFYSLSAKAQWDEPPLEGAVEVNIKLYFKDKKRRDIDNYNKLLLDSLTGICWKDDSQIIKMTVEKYICKWEPKIEIEIYGKGT